MAQPSTARRDLSKVPRCWRLLAELRSQADVSLISNRLSDIVLFVTVLSFLQCALDTLRPSMPAMMSVRAPVGRSRVAASARRVPGERQLHFWTPCSCHCPHRVSPRLVGDITGMASLRRIALHRAGLIGRAWYQHAAE